MYLSLTLSERDLVRQCVAGKEEAFERLYAMFAKKVYNSVYRITNDSAETEDIVQEAFCIAFEGIGKLRNKENFEGWIKRIALNKAVSHWRKNKPVFFEDTNVELAANDESYAEDEIIFQCKVEDVKEAIKNLPDGYRTIISLHLLEDISQEEIARMLHIRHATVRSQYHRAKKKVLMALKNKMYDGKG